MKTTLEITLPNDFELLGLITSSDPKEIIQHYINRVSLPKQMSVHPDDPSGSVMELFLETAISQDPDQVENSVEKLLKSGYQEELENIIKLDLEQPECEAMLREAIKKWKNKAVFLRQELKKSGREYNICNYGN